MLHENKDEHNDTPLSLNIPRNPPWQAAPFKALIIEIQGLKLAIPLQQFTTILHSSAPS